VIPMLYVTFQTIRELGGERIRRLRPRRSPLAPAPAQAQSGED
jgi:hypothetical protein